MIDAMQRIQEPITALQAEWRKAALPDAFASIRNVIRKLLFAHSHHQKVFGDKMDDLVLRQNSTLDEILSIRSTTADILQQWNLLSREGFANKQAVCPGLSEKAEFTLSQEEQDELIAAFVHQERPSLHVEKTPSPLLPATAAPLTGFSAMGQFPVGADPTSLNGAPGSPPSRRQSHRWDEDDDSSTQNRTPAKSVKQT